MKITVDFLDALLIRGWSVTGRPRQRTIEFRDPSGISGDSYQVKSMFDDFPAPVEKWIRENIPMETIGSVDVFTFRSREG